MSESDNSIYVDLVNSERLYQDYVKAFPRKKFPEPFQFDQTLPVSENLNKLALFALKPNTTLAIAFSYSEVFIDLISRWIESPLQFESYVESKNQVPGSVILQTLTRLVNIYNEATSSIEYFITQHDFFKALQNTSVGVYELRSILLSFTRLIKYDSHRFKPFINPEILHFVLNKCDDRVCKLLAVEILTTYLEASEVSRHDLINHHVGEGEIVGKYEDDEIDYRFLSILEAKRASNYTSVPKIENNPSTKVIRIEKVSLCPLVTSVCGVLVNCAGQGKPSSDEEDRFVATPKAVSVLRQLALDMQRNQPVLVYGKAGSGKTFLINQLAKYMQTEDSIVKIHLGEQTDAKLLLGTYTSGEKPGTFQWRSGVLTTAVQEGKWVLIEDIDKAPTEVLSVLLTLLEKRELTIPSRGEVIKAKNGFQLISTIRVSSEVSKPTLPDIIGLRMWELVGVAENDDRDFHRILSSKFPVLQNMIPKFLKCYKEVVAIYGSNKFISLNKGSHPRVISFRDLIKFCQRSARILSNENITALGQLLESSVYDNIFAEAVDCYGSAITEYAALLPLVEVIGESLEIATSRVNLYLNNHVPNFQNETEKLTVGRAQLQKGSGKKSNQSSFFARTNHSLRLMEQICVAIDMVEPVLLVGETGTGKTTVVQQVARMMNKKITVINVSQQTESGDLLGGYKPVDAKMVAIPVLEKFEELFTETFSKKKNEKFTEILAKSFNRRKWRNVVKLWREAVKMANSTMSQPEVEEDQPRKKQKFDPALVDRWAEFSRDVDAFESQSQSLENSFIFDFVEGPLVHAVRQGHWLLLDEINLASSDTLESIADLLAETNRSILLAERGDTDCVRAHRDFRLFGCMNPSTDVGKRDLPMSIRSRFSEIYVHSPDRDIQDLLAIIDKYVGRYAVADEWVGNDIAELYLEAKRLSDSNKIVDGANQKPHFSIRTLTRTLLYVGDIVSVYGLRRSLFEGFCMSFLTLLDRASEDLLRPVIEKYTVGKLKNARSVMAQIPRQPAGDHVQFKHYWLRKGQAALELQHHYIITPFVEKNMLNLVRATATRRFPVLVQGPTSAGKTSMIEYLARLSGHTFVRINNHEHTDLQEYLGTYVSDSSGKLSFREGVLVEALRKGHWIVLDELNLAPTDVLEALNRLLDDNRELLVPETGEIVRPHPDFMLFATQNPPGLYGGRKLLSRAFRNRFLELHFDDIPQDELEIILRERCKIAPSYAKRIVEVYRQLSVHRQSTRVFEKHSFATLRDLFRWAQRESVGYEELAAHGYMLLAERVRKAEDRVVVQETIEKVMKVKLDMDAFYEKLENKQLLQLDRGLVWTKAMRRLAVLVDTSIKYNEPLLLVGETGCGKTSVCQVLAEFLGRNLVVLNAHENTETGDILGGQRPTRKLDVAAKLAKILEPFEGDGDVVAKFEAVKSQLSLSQLTECGDLVAQLNSLFTWADGPLTQCMKQGSIFLLDEISLADDSVLERLNSVLEPERTLYLAEKGTEDAFIKAKDDFHFLATMNPGGDYGKKELSPALRNRFTEIWVPSMEDFNDVKQIVGAKLDPVAANLVDAVVQFTHWFAQRFLATISLRDILAWVSFINGTDIDLNLRLLHGASMVFIDALGTNNLAHLSENEATLASAKMECVQQLGALVGADLEQSWVQPAQVSLDSHALTAGSFSVPRKGSNQDNSFNFMAPTTSHNVMRVVRAMQLNKPILLEGSPGVGKTSLVSAISTATGNPLIRINLSEQTDLVDLFGSDTPAENGATGEFVWRDAPFLRAMKLGEWVLLDELNLASQSVLEGLNACLDHRGEAYIPELDKKFPRHPQFRVFAAQNPQFQGGGRKGLPKSFVNRFNVVYVDMLKASDLNLISTHLFPLVDRDQSAALIEFMARLEEEVVVKKAWGHSGAPWEFNLRDTLRWLSLYSSKNLAQDVSLADFFNMIICQRFRSAEDVARAKQLWSECFGQTSAHSEYFHLAPDYVQANGAVVKRSTLVHHSAHYHNIALQCNYPFISSALQCIQHNLPLILVGPAGSGKTSLVRFLAHTMGAKLDEFAMNSDVDSMDILGGYEQVDFMRQVQEIVAETRKAVVTSTLANMMSDDISAVSFIDNNSITLANYGSFHKLLLSSSLPGPLIEASQELLDKISASESVKFAWFDGLLVRAVEKGHWLILDNANLCSPSVLDRLNSLLEKNGSLIINECSLADGLPRTLKPHPNFRLFLTLDPRYGELSRAMRNRGIEMYMDTLEVRATAFDRSLLRLGPEIKNEVDGLETLSIQNPTQKVPVSAYIGPNSCDRVLALASDCIESVQNTNAVLSVLPLSTLSLWKSFCDTAAASTEFSTLFVEACYVVEENLQQLVLTDFSGKILALNLDVADVATFPISQSVHPLVNPYTTYTMEQLAPHVNTTEPSALLEISSRLVVSEKLMKSTEASAMLAKVSDLTYLEASAAHKLGRNLKKVPRLDIYSFVRAVHEFLKLSVLVCLEKSLFSVKVFAPLLELHEVWIKFYETSRHQNESKLRVYQNLVIEWIEKHADTFDLSELLKVAASFSSELRLTTGLSMTEVWEHSRGEYPEEEQKWNNLYLLEQLASEFDTVAQKQASSSADLVAGLRSTIVDTYHEVISNTMSDADFEGWAEKLKAGIQDLQNVSSYSRANLFIDQFRAMKLFVQSKLILESSLRNEFLHLSSFSDVSTVGLVGSLKTFKPYPAIFDSMFTVKDGKYCSFVPGLFTDALVSSSLEKAVNFSNEAGKDLQQNVADVKILGRKLVSNSESLLSSQLDAFRKILFDWFIHLVNAHDKVELPEISHQNFAAIIDSLQIFANSFFGTILEKYLVPALYTLLEAQDAQSLGKSWVLFSCGAIQLYVPSSAFDPAIKEHIIYELFSFQQDSSRELAESWEKVAQTLCGAKMNVQDKLPQTESAQPDKPRVFRKSESIDGLFEEWKSFMQSSMDAAPIKKLLESVTNGSFGEVGVFQNNSTQFLVRLKANYYTYADLNDILKGYIYGLKFGFELLQLEKTTSLSKTWPVHVANLADSSDVTSSFEKIKKLVKKMKVDSVVPEKLMVHFIMLAFGHQNDTVIEDALQSLFYRWSLRRMKEEQAAAQQGSLYKYHDEDNAEEDFKTMFPDYEDVLELDGETTTKTDSFDSVYYDLARLYVNKYLHQADVDVSEWVSRGSKIVQYLNQNDTINESTLSSLILGLSQCCDFSDSEINFYRDGSTAEFNKALVVMTGLKTSVDTLLAEWPEHDTLQTISRIVDEFTNLPVSSPLARVLQKVEQIYTYIAEWEKYASSKVTLKQYFDQLTQLIVSWRKRELSSWKSLFKYEDDAVEQSIGKWWFHLFETILIPFMNDEEVEEYRNVKLLAALNVFMSNATYGEFRPRLDLLKAFKNHISVSNSETFHGLCNFISFYDQFSATVTEKIAVQKATLEKDINEVILLASWKDVNIDALKQSARKSHNNLYKIVRKYRDILNTPVSSVIEAGVPLEELSSVNTKTVRNLDGFTVFSDFGKLKQVSTFESRPTRLQNLALIEKNMAVYVSKLELESLPQLEDFSKDLTLEMERLSKETPKEAKDDKAKKVIASLKTQKRKLLADTLKELRRMGLKLTKPQPTVNSFLSSATTFQDSWMQGSDVYFFRILDLLPRLRASISDLSPDVPQPDAEKALSYAEGLIVSIFSTRDPLAELSGSLDKMISHYNEMNRVAEMPHNNTTVARTSVKDSCKENLTTIGRILFWLPKLAAFGVQVGEACTLFGEQNEVSSIMNEVLDFCAKWSAKKKDASVISSAEVDLINEFNEDLAKLTSSLQQFSTSSVGFLATAILQWLSSAGTCVVNTSTSLTEVSSVEDVEAALRNLSYGMMISMQKVMEHLKEEITEEDDGWLKTSQLRLFAYVKSSHHRNIVARTENVLNAITKVEYNETTSSLVSALVSFSMPLVFHYTNMIKTLLERTRSNYISLSRSTFILSRSLYTLATKGFCEPQKSQEEKQDDNLHDGTGLGDGEGVNNNSKGIEQDDDLTEDAQKENDEKGDKNEDEEDDDAVDMEGDMAGDLEEASDQEKEDEEGDENDDLDEEIDDIDDLDPNAIDEKMWDEEAKEDKEKDSEAMPENSKDNDEMEANEDEGENQEKNEKEGEGEEEKEEQENDDDAEEGDDVGEQEDEVKNEENEQLENNVPETETLDLPEDLNLDEDGEDKEEEENDFSDGMDVDEDEKEENAEDVANEENENAENEEENAEDAEEAEENAEEGEENVDADAESDVDMDGDENDKGESEVQEDAMSDEEIDQGDEKEQQVNDKQEEGITDEAGDLDDNSDPTSNATATQSTGEKGEGSDAQTAEENEDIGASGTAQNNDDQETETAPEQNSNAQESLKQLGDSLKEFHKRHQEIQQAQRDEEQKEQKASENPEEFQHLEGENADFDTQALGAADKDQIQSIDEDKAIEDDREPEIKEEPEVKHEKEDMVAQKDEEDVKDGNDLDVDDFDGKAGVVGERKKEQNDDRFIKSEFEEEKFEDLEERTNIDDITISNQDVAPVDIDEARSLWRNSDLAVQELASGLCEQLRLILEPTLSTKLRGDYKTGKRLNMKRIIPYIASEFKKDKIWLRRTKPSKRQYQIMIAVDDSKSMSESNAVELAFHSIALVSKALTQLESGGLSIVRFGEDVKLVHPFERPFNQEAGARIFQWFDFQQTRTNVKMLCDKALHIFEDARGSSSSDLWQLQIIISDGVCEDHETIQRLVRKAREEKVMLVFVIIDGINNKESILDMSQVSYVDEGNGMKLKVQKYLDSFPFEFYVVVRNIRELPEMLALVLRQYFAEILNM